MRTISTAVAWCVCVCVRACVRACVRVCVYLSITTVSCAKTDEPIELSLGCGFWGPKEVHGRNLGKSTFVGHICTWLTRRARSIFSTIFAIGRQQRCGLWLSVYCSRLLLCLQTASSCTACSILAEFRQTSPWLHQQILQHCFCRCFHLHFLLYIQCESKKQDT